MTGFVAEAIVRKVGELVGFEIEDGKRLFPARGVRSVPAVEENGKAAVGRECDGGRQIIGWARIAGNVRQERAVRKLGGAWLILSN